VVVFIVVGVIVDVVVFMLVDVSNHIFKVVFECQDSG
jgi:hypothetical protein